MIDEVLFWIRFLFMLGLLSLAIYVVVNQVTRGSCVERVELWDGGSYCGRFENE